jgi:hypothetical protein
LFCFEADDQQDEEEEADSPTGEEEVKEPKYNKLITPGRFFDHFLYQS